MPEKKTAIVTGASRGIGAGLVGAFLKEGYIVVAALALTLPLQSQQSAIGDSTEASGSVSQPASAASKQAQQVDQDPTAVKKRIEQPAEKSPMDQSTAASNFYYPTSCMASILFSSSSTSISQSWTASTSDSAGSFRSWIEAQLAPNNYNMTHSLLYTIDPFTDTGAIASLRRNKQWMIQLGVSCSHDVACWTDDAKPSGILCLNYSTSSNNDNLYGCANTINDAKYAYNNLQEYDLTWYHKFNAKWHMATETWYTYENNVPNVAGNVANPIKPELGANGVFCAAGQLRCTAPEYAIVNYLNRDVTSKFMIGFRFDLLNDKKGQRTGIDTKYTENTFYLTR
jgi:Putative beta-barrel porin-2, OmpL-like. bbp2